VNDRPAATLLPGDVVAGQWRVERCLGRGGMGEVHLVTDLRLGQPRALKVVLPGALDDEGLARFAREAQLAARVDRRGGVVRVHTSGADRGRPYCVMDYVPGRGLADALRAGLDASAVAGTVAALARTLAACHAAGVVHRDVKPENVLLREEDGAPVLLDFGLAWSADVRRLTETGALLGTPAYMAPEQLQGGAAASAPAVDVYALGAVLYHGLTGRPPFAGDAVQVVSALAKGPPPAPARLRPDVDPALAALCERAMRREPAARPDAAALAEALEAWRRGERPRGPAALRRVAAATAVAGLAALAAWLTAAGPSAGGGRPDDPAPGPTASPPREPAGGGGAGDALTDRWLEAGRLALDGEPIRSADLGELAGDLGLGADGERAAREAALERLLREASPRLAAAVGEGREREILDGLRRFAVLDPAVTAPDWVADVLWGRLVADVVVPTPLAEDYAEGLERLVTWERAAAALDPGGELPPPFRAELASLVRSSLVVYDVAPSPDLVAAVVARGLLDERDDGLVLARMGSALHNAARERPDPVPEEALLSEALRGAPPGERELLRLLPAADAPPADREALADAIARSRRLLESWPPEGSPRRRAEVAVVLAQLLAQRLGRASPDEAADLRRAALARCREAEPALRELAGAASIVLTTRYTLTCEDGAEPAPAALSALVADLTAGLERATRPQPERDTTAEVATLRFFRGLTRLHLDDLAAGHADVAAALALRQDRAGDERRLGRALAVLEERVDARTVAGWIAAWDVDLRVEHAAALADEGLDPTPWTRDADVALRAGLQPYADPGFAARAAELVRRIAGLDAALERVERLRAAYAREGRDATAGAAGITASLRAAAGDD